MRILFVSSTPGSHYDEAFKIDGSSLPMAQQKYNSLLLKGLKENDVECIVLNTVDLLAKVQDEDGFQREPVEEEGIRYIFCPYYRNRLKRILSAKKTIKKVMNDFQKSDDLIVIDCLQPYAEEVFRYSHNTCVIVTDLPKFMYVKNTLRSKLALKNKNRMIYEADYLVGMTRRNINEMNSKTNRRIVIEGIAQPGRTQPKTDFSHKAFMYAGVIDKDNGIYELVEAFKDINSDYSLWLCGKNLLGDELFKLIDNHPRIEYKGLLSYADVKKLEHDSSFMVVTRHTDLPYIEYSFPSKLMEYVSSGTPTITTHLKCIPDEYQNSVIYFPDDDKDGIKEGLLTAINMSDTKKTELSSNALSLIKGYKIARHQARKLIEMVNNEK